jgi:hypothetical protein
VTSISLDSVTIGISVVVSLFTDRIAGTFLVSIDLNVDSESAVATEGALVLTFRSSPEPQPENPSNPTKTANNIVYRN